MPRLRARRLDPGSAAARSRHGDRRAYASRSKRRRKRGPPLTEEFGLPPSLSEAGQGLVEYALVIALVAVMAIVALMFLGDQVSTTLSTVGGQL
jgi:Flp pilus assembly pilin Flp